jgi:hypothetical protein
MNCQNEQACMRLAAPCQTRGCFQNPVIALAGDDDPRISLNGAPISVRQDEMGATFRID